MSSIELVLYTPLLMLLTFLVVQMSLAYLGNQVASAAAREGARVARVGGGTPQACAAGEAKARSIIDSVGRGLLRTTTPPSVRPVGADQVRAQVRGVPQYLIPFVDFEVEQVVQGPVERFVPDTP
ncbi:MAG: TadE family protein [Angustibacter sp.]